MAVRRQKKPTSKPSAAERAKKLAGGNPNPSKPDGQRPHFSRPEDADEPEPDPRPEAEAMQEKESAKIPGPVPEKEHESPIDSDDLELGGGYDTILTTLFKMDSVEETAEEIESFLQFTHKASSADYGKLVDSLDEASEKTRQALRILISARVRVKDFEVDIGVLRSAMYREAENTIAKEIADLENPRTAKATKASIEAMMETEYHDEVRSLTHQQNEAKGLVEYLEGLYKIVGDRSRDLRAMINNVRG